MHETCAVREEYPFRAHYFSYFGAMQTVVMTAALSFIVRQAGEGRSSPSATMEH